MAPLATPTNLAATPPPVAAAFPHQPHAAGSDNALTLDEVLRLVREQDPALDAARLEARALEGDALQAALRPNPELGVAVENFGGNGEFAGADESESTFVVAQRIELGGKRQRRTDVAAQALQSETQHLRDKEAQSLAEAKSAFVDLLGAQIETELAVANADQAAALLTDLERHPQPRAVSTIDMERARLLVSRTLMEAGESAAERSLARQRLAARWGGHGHEIGNARGDLLPLPPLPSLAALEEQIAQSPSVAAAETEAARTAAELELARAQAFPDVSLGAGVRYLAGSGETVFVAQTVVPLPVFDRNQGAIAAAEQRVLRAARERAAIWNEVHDSIVTSHLDMRAAADRAGHLEDTFLPAARSALDAFQRGYHQGAATYFDIVDARRNLLELRIEHVHALLAYHRAVAAIEGALGLMPATLPLGDASQRSAR